MHKYIRYRSILIAVCVNCFVLSIRQAVSHSGIFTNAIYESEVFSRTTKDNL